jgi:hypothetical protein
VKEEICELCKVVIGVQETAYIWQGSVICEQCYNKVNQEQSSIVSNEPGNQRWQSKRLSTAFYISSLLGALFVAGLLRWFDASIREEDIATYGFEAPLWLVVLYAVVVVCVFWYKSWASIQDGHASTSPWKAVVLMFIPLFNVYWFVYTFVGFAEDYNAFIERHMIKTKPLPTRLFLVYIVIFLPSLAIGTALRQCLDVVQEGPSTVIEIAKISSILSVVGLVISLAIFIILLVKICDAVNALGAAVPQSPTKA